MSLDLEIDFSSAQFERKLKSSLMGEQPLKKAALVRGKKSLVVDATAGRGEDSFLLAAMGFQVIAFEKNPEVFRQLSAALEKLSDEHLAHGLLKSGKISFFNGDFAEGINARGLSPDVIYLDPMYPKMNKSARSQKHVENLRAVVGAHDEELEQTLLKALNLAKEKVILKRPSSEREEFKAQHVYEGKSTRYEVFLPNVKLQKIALKVT